MDDMFDGFFGGGGGGSRRGEPKKGPKMRVKVAVTLADIYNGVGIKVFLTK